MNLDESLELPDDTDPLEELKRIRREREAAAAAEAPGPGPLSMPEPTVPKPKGPSRIREIAAAPFASAANLVTSFGEGAARLGSNTYKAVTGDKALNWADRTANTLRGVREQVNEAAAPETKVGSAARMVSDFGTNALPYVASGGALGVAQGAAVSAGLTGVQAQSGKDASLTGLIADASGNERMRAVADNPWTRTAADMALDVGMSAVAPAIKGVKTARANTLESEARFAAALDRAKTGASAARGVKAAAAEQASREAATRSAQAAAEEQLLREPPSSASQMARDFAAWKNEPRAVPYEVVPRAKPASGTHPTVREALDARSEPYLKMAQAEEEAAARTGVADATIQADKDITEFNRDLTRAAREAHQNAIARAMRKQAVQAERAAKRKTATEGMTPQQRRATERLMMTDDDLEMLSREMGLPEIQVMDQPKKGGGYKVFDIGGAAGEALKTRAGKSAAIAATGAAMKTSDNEDLQFTGNGLMLLAGLHGVGTQRMKGAGAKVGGKLVESLRGNPTGEKILNAISADILADPKVKELIGAYDELVAKGHARGQELAKSARSLGAEGDRAVSDIIEGENFEKLSPENTAAIGVAQRIADEFAELGNMKVDAGLLKRETLAKREGKYLPRVYAEHLGDEVMAGRTPRGATNKPRIQAEKMRNEKLTDAERNALGEIREASFRSGYGIEKGYRNVAAAKLFAGLKDVEGAVHPEFVAAADALMAAKASGDEAATTAAREKFMGLSAGFKDGTGGYTKLPDTKEMGILRGMPVRNDVAGYLKGVEPLTGKPGALMRAWKRVHTEMNPGTHVGNTISNGVIAHMSGLSLFEQLMGGALGRAKKDFESYGEATRYLAERGVLDRGLPIKGEGVPSGARHMKTALTDLAATTRPETAKVLAEKGITPRGKAAELGTKAMRKTEELYAKEDGIFRVAVFQKLTKNGMDPKEAAKYVDEAFVNYRSRSPLLGAIKNTVSPFVMYPAKAIPFVAGQIVEHPERWMALAALWGGMDLASQKAVGRIANEDRRPDQRRNKYLGYLAPGFTQLPFTNAEGDKFGIDVSRWTPFSALTGSAAPGSAAFQVFGDKLPAMAQPGGPWLDVGARMAGVDPFTGEKMFKPGDDAMDKFGTIAKAGAALTLPSAAAFHAPRVAEDIANADYKAAMTDALGFAGARPSAVRPGAQAAREEYKFEEARRNIMATLRRDMQAAKSPSRQEALQRRAGEKLQRLADEYVENYRRVRGQ